MALIEELARAITAFVVAHSKDAAADCPSVEEMTTPPIVGQRYRVPCLYLGLWVPVLTPRHADPELPGGAAPHYHLDLRFVGQDMLFALLSPAHPLGGHRVGARAHHGLWVARDGCRDPAPCAPVPARADRAFRGTLPAGRGRAASAGGLSYGGAVPAPGRAARRHGRGGAGRRAGARVPRPRRAL